MISFGNYCSNEAATRGRREIFNGDLENWKLDQNPNFNALVRTLVSERARLDYGKGLQKSPHAEGNKEFTEGLIKESSYAVSLLEKILMEFGKEQKTDSVCSTL